MFRIVEGKIWPAQRNNSAFQINRGYTRRAELKNQLEKLKPKLGVRWWKDWYKVGKEDVIAAGGAQIIKRFDGSLVKTLCELYPDHAWEVWNFKHERVPRYFWVDEANQRKYLEWLKEQLKIETDEDWYRVQQSDLEKNGGIGLLTQYPTIAHAIIAIYSTQSWKLFLFQALPTAYFSELTHQKQLMDYIAFEKWNFKSLEGWYTVSIDQATGVSKNVSKVLSYYNNSLFKALTKIYENFPWNIYKFVHKVDVWSDRSTHKDYFEWLRKQLGYETMEDWYKVTTNDFERNHGAALLARFYEGSPAKALMEMYPEYTWKPWKFDRAPRGWWSDVTNQRFYLDSIRKDLGIEKKGDWLKIQRKDILALEGNSLLRQYDNSFVKALLALYPNEDWKSWQFQFINKKFWNDKKNQRGFLEWVASKSGINQPEDWYKVTSKTVKELGGTAIMLTYGNLANAVTTLFPEYNLLPWKFDSSPKSIWKVDSNVQEFLDKFIKEFKIESMEDWYRVAAHQIAQFGGGTLVKKFGSLYGFLKHVYPEYPWNAALFEEKGKRSSQRWLKILVSEIFPDKKLIEDFIHPELKFTSSENMELDVYLPTLSLAFEYQGAHHYKDIPYFGSIHKYRERDEQKKQACDASGITLIPIPYWWDNSRSSLEATIHIARPDLIPKEKVITDPIPSEPPYKRLLLDPFYAHRWPSNKEPVGWWLLPKLGPLVRWDGANILHRTINGEKELALSRSLREYLSTMLPQPIELQLTIAGTPADYLDEYLRLRNLSDAWWKRVKLIVYDLSSSTEKLEDRVESLKGILNLQQAEKGENNPSIDIAKYYKCESSQQYAQMLNKLAPVGCGLLLRQPESEIRTETLFESQMYDTSLVQCIQVSEQADSLICKQTNGAICTIKAPSPPLTNLTISPDTDSGRSIGPGTIIMVKHAGESQETGQLRFPFYFRALRGTNAPDWKQLVEREMTTVNQ